MVQVIARPELHGEAPSDQVLGEASEDEGAVCEQAGAALFVEVAVAEHGRVGVEVADARGSLSGRGLKTSPSEDSKRACKEGGSYLARIEDILLLII